MSCTPIGPVNTAYSSHVVPTDTTLSTIASGVLSKINPPYRTQREFAKNGWQCAPPVICKSFFVSDQMAKHLMREKDDTTNMDRALNAFVTPICMIHLAGDYLYLGHHTHAPTPYGMARRVVLSATVPPDFKNDSVMMEVIRLRKEPYIGEDWNCDEQIPFSPERDQRVRKHMVYHLTEEHQLPSIQTSTSLSWDEALSRLNQDITGFSKSLRNLSVSYGEDQPKVSLEAWFNIYVYQLRNEFEALERLLPQGYVYTIDPPTTFASYFKGDATVSNRLQILAFKRLLKEKDFKNLKAIAFNDCADEKGLELWQACVAATPIEVCKKSALFPEEEHYTYTPKEEWKTCALVLHNNSGGVSQHIETTRMNSLNGILSAFSDLALVLDRRRKDLLDHVITVKPSSGSRVLRGDAIGSASLCEDVPEGM